MFQGWERWDGLTDVVTACERLLWFIPPPWFTLTVHINFQQPLRGHRLTLLLLHISTFLTRLQQLFIEAMSGASCHRPLNRFIFQQ